ncbi:FG-GAP-like repeat-containing protein [Roseomonas sp. AR75]|uniref:FG-GAP-like repeat-containing protein n=1 Tax=Roseomonas sp. AR75 TaxID=2562311 RepID=UPI001484E4C6|nr:FG-GAP-like repeat-containing protein [Roseomonas sp. AR75]
MPSSIRDLAPSLSIIGDTDPQLLDADVAFASAAVLAGGQLVVGGLLAEDRVSILAGAGGITFDGTTVGFGGTSIGSASGGIGTSFVVTFNGNVTAAAVDALIQALSYANVSATPTTNRTLTLDVVDAAGGHLQGTSQFGGLTSITPFIGVSFAAYHATPAFADLDGDGKLDLVAGGQYGGIAWWKNTGTAAAPAFTAQSAALFGSIAAGYYSAPALADLDGDGDPDMLVANGTGQFRYWRNTGTAQAPAFTEQTGAANPFNGIGGGYLSLPVFVDLDGDGLLDLVAGNSDGTLQAWRNTGTALAPAFAPFATNPFAGIDVGYLSAPTFMDLDGDGDRDLVVGNLTRQVLAWENTGGPTAPAFSPLAGTANPFNGIVTPNDRAKPVAIDLTGDGRLDLAVFDFRGNLPVVRLDITPLPSIAVAVTAAPTITSGAATNVQEGGWFSNVLYLATATDPDGPNPIAWSLTGADAALFTIGPDGAVRFKAMPDFEAPLDAGGNNVYDINVVASDGLGSDSRAVAITVTDLAEPPRLAGLALALTFPEPVVNAAPQRIDTDVIFTAGYSLAGGSLTVSGLLAEDRVSIAHQGNGAGQIGFDGTQVRFGGVVIGTATGGVGTSFTVALNAAANSAGVEALIEQLTYANASDTPTPSRTLTIDMVDAAGQRLGTNASGAFQNDAALAALLPTELLIPPAGSTAGLGLAPNFVDLDGDGLAEIVGTSVLSTDLSQKYGGTQVWKNIGTAENPDYVALTGTDNPLNGAEFALLQTHAFADLDGDGLTDLVGRTLQGAFSTNVGAKYGSLGFWRNTGTETAPVFTAVTGLDNPVGGIAVGPTASLAFGDLNGDGLQDLIVGRSTDTTNFSAAPIVLDAWLNTGTATQPVFTKLSGAADPFAGLQFPGGALAGFTLADLNGDGRPDLVATVVNTTSVIANSSLRIWLNGDGVFTELDAADNPFTGLFFDGSLTPVKPLPTGQPRFVDLNGDGVQEVVLATFPGDSLATATIADLSLSVFSGGVKPATVTIGVTAEDDAPRGPALQALAPLAEDGTRLLTTAALLAGWADPEGKPLSLTNLAQISGRPSTLLDNGNGTWLFTPAAHDDSGVAFQFTVSDGLVSANGVAMLDLTPVNDAPVGDVALSATDSQLTASATLTDADGMGAVTLQWQSRAGAGAWTDIAGATGPNLLPGPALAGLGLRAVARYTDGGGTAEEVASTSIGQMGTEGADSLTGSAQPSVFFGRGGGDRLAGGDGNETLNGEGGADTLTGGKGDDRLAGGAGDDSVDGGLGTDTTVLSGLRADYLVNALGGGLFTVVDLRAGQPEGADTVSGVEFLEFADTLVAVSGSGGPGSGDDVLEGDAGANTIDALGGNDAVSGLGGADRLLGGAGNDSLYGGAQNDTLDGGTGNDSLVGEAGADSMAGGVGNDAYDVDNIADKTLELRDAGSDTVFSSVTWTLAANFEDLVLTGNAAINGTGNSLSNVITGNDAANQLVGAGKADTLIGGGGNDLYLPDATDTLIEQDGGGYDTVILNASFALSDHIEELRFNGTANARGDGNAANNLMVGNVGNNRLLGYDGNDTLSGGQGNDTLQGGEGADSLVGGEGVDRLDGGNGDDTYLIGDLDQIIELVGGGTDTVLSSISYTLTPTVENLTLLGNGDLTATGNALANVITGNGGSNLLRGLGEADRLSGGQGNDTIEGGVGADTLTGGGGFDRYLWLVPNEGGDTLTDFRPGDDLLTFASATFGGLPVGALDAARFASNAPSAAIGQFVYTKATGVLMWDADGTGGGAAITIATLSNKPTLAATDLVIA